MKTAFVTSRRVSSGWIWKIWRRNVMAGGKSEPAVTGTATPPPRKTRHQLQLIKGWWKGMTSDVVNVRAARRRTLKNTPVWGNLLTRLSPTNEIFTFLLWGRCCGSVSSFGNSFVCDFPDLFSLTTPLRGERQTLYTLTGRYLIAHLCPHRGTFVCLNKFSPLLFLFVFLF